MEHKQWVCKTCGYNMVDEMPDRCPFCGVSHEKFISWEEAEKVYKVTPKKVSDRVTQLISVPRLGYEHAAYRIETDDGAVWIDCPSAYNRDLEPVERIYFTHNHFMGASNQYRQLWDAKVYLHSLEAEHPLVAKFPVDRKFNDSFQEKGIEAIHVGGHTPGFTIYIFEDVLFICDYVFSPEKRIQFNPFGPKQKTHQQALKILEKIERKNLKTVCGFNYVMDFAPWLENFKTLLN